MAATAAAMTAAEIASVAATAISVAATVAATAQANANAKAQEEAAEKRNQQLVEQTVANYDELADIELQAQQQAQEDTQAVQKDFLQQKGRINVMAAAMGTAGQSLDSQLKDLEREKYQNYDTILTSRQAEMDNIRSQAETMRYQAANSMNVTPVSRPSWASTALSVGSTALGGYGTLKETSKQSEQVKPVQTTTLKSGG
ncbi:internal virion protein [Vibrio phage D530]